jgi:GTPase-associated protein 1, N-terminal domain type 2/GTPase-associated protein 1, middle domain
MSQELHYTSAARGLEPGRRGFCTVAVTPRMPVALADRLEALSGYQPVFPPDDPSAALNPLLISHLRLTVGGKVLSVLSRIGPAGLDYSGRPNKYAHHVVLEDKERPEGGPAWLLSDPLFMEASWSGEPREIPVGRVPLQGDRQPGVARAWQSLTDDAGWAGVLAESFLSDPRRPVFLLFQPGMDLLPLFVEALALLPSSRRWDVEFSTYYSQLPQGVSCIWRGVLAGSDEARSAERLPNALVLDLSHPIGRAEGASLVHLARTGEMSESPEKSRVVEAGKHPVRAGRHQSVPIAPDASHLAPAASRASAPPRILAPELARLLAPRGDAVPTRRLRKRPWVPVAFLTAACGVALVAIALTFRAGGVAQLLGLNTELSQEIARSREIASAAIREAEIAKLRDSPVVAPTATDAVTATPPELAANTNERPPDAPKGEAEKPHEVTLPLPNSTAENPPELKPSMTYLAIPAMRKSVVGGSRPNAIDLRLFSKEVDVKPKFLNIDTDVLRVSDVIGGVVTLSRNSSSHNFGNSAVAQFITRESTLEFQWLDNNVTDVIGAIRDMVLKYTAKDGYGLYYVLFRDPQTIGEAISLNPVGHPKEWKNEALKGTKWECRIREWKITPKSGDISEWENVFHGSASPPASNLSKDILREDAITGRASIDLRIGPQNVDIHIKFKSVNGTIVGPSERAQLLSAWTLESQQLESELPKLSSDKKNEHEKVIARLKQQIHELEQVQKAESHLSRGSLSMIVTLELKDHTILDIAKFGDFGEKAQ